MALTGLADVNRRVPALMAELQSRNGLESGACTRSMSDLLSELLALLLQAAEWLRAASEEELACPETQLEINRYRENMLQLRQQLPHLQTQLLMQRAQLETERAHLQAASAWVSTGQCTFR